MSNNGGMTLTEFLEARIDEDEARASSGWACLGESRWETTNEGQDFLTPSAVLAECAAKRAIIEQHQTYVKAAAESVGIAFIGARGGQEVTGDVLKVFASVYRGHPDYQQEWSV